jgi:hypothetical protein
MKKKEEEEEDSRHDMQLLLAVLRVRIILQF